MLSWTFNQIQKFSFIPQVFCEILWFKESCILICFEVLTFCWKHVVFVKSTKETLALCAVVFLWIRLLPKPSKPYFRYLQALEAKPIWTYFQKLRSVFFLTLWCETSWEKNRKNWWSWNLVFQTNGKTNEVKLLGHFC